jgi:stearoyl-CoA desaturase (delta-9 desaturase)
MNKHHPIRWGTLAVLAVFHLLALAAFFTPFQWHFLPVMIGMYLWMGMATTVYLHRGLTHRALEMAGWLKFVFCLGAAVGQQGDPVGWVGHHRRHHAKSDRPGEDVHTPKDGFWYSHFEWIVRADDALDQDVRNLAKDIREKYWYAKYCEIPVVFLLPHVAMAVTLYLTMGLSGMLWGLYVPMVALYHATWAVNSVCHTPGIGYRTTETHEQSRNFWLIGLVGFGEGWHNNHHASQTRAALGQAWWEIDAGKILIGALERVGLVWDVRWQTPQRAAAVTAVWEPESVTTPGEAQPS